MQRLCCSKFNLTCSYKKAGEIGAQDAWAAMGVPRIHAASTAQDRWGTVLPHFTVDQKLPLLCHLCAAPPHQVDHPENQMRCKKNTQCTQSQIKKYQIQTKQTPLTHWLETPRGI